MSAWCLTETVRLRLGTDSTGQAGPEIQLMLINRTPPRRVDLACCAFVARVEKNFSEVYCDNFDLCWWTVLMTKSPKENRARDWSFQRKLGVDGSMQPF